MGAGPRCAQLRRHGEQALTAHPLTCSTTAWRHDSPFTSPKHALRSCVVQILVMLPGVYRGELFAWHPVRTGLAVCTAAGCQQLTAAAVETAAATSLFQVSCLTGALAMNSALHIAAVHVAGIPWVHD